MHGAAGWDEATPIGPFIAFDVARGEIRRHDIDPREFGMSPCKSADLAGGDAAANLSALDRGIRWRATAVRIALR